MVPVIQIFVGNTDCVATTSQSRVNQSTVIFRCIWMWIVLLTDQCL